MTVLAPPLDAISRQARPYPADALPVGGTGLALFAAAYLGHNDVIHMARKDMRVTCVDTDAHKLTEMMHLYPEDWQFIHGDAWEYAERYPWARNRPDMFDVVSVDTFTGDATKRSMGTLELWCSLARKLVTATVATDTAWYIPAGWRGYLFPRSNLASWLVLQRD